MKTFVSAAIALGLILGASVGASADTMSTPKTKASCEKAHMMWDAAMKKCTKGAM